ncbi:precorrin-6A synthase (deacetylating) [Novosphingobium beihaiensis]|uniref:Precorrin-6A synthase [deacetylating] n=1 Tax=Novosphingobium beihaiensis TaxID=2930389 RepID=A0ABT0BVU6_9SPHN|nr:precorrin-6A synthase (deacetylating) [Novosphingobium beihaiensis]MCJ2189003.1 precorrin-6A synthase (deacetylating) [Novosphingobium beihaiensis]
MIELDLIGIGTGNPDHLTGQAIRAMNEADLILLPRKGDAKSDLIDLRRGICANVLTSSTRVVEFDLPVRDAAGDYHEAVGEWHDAIAAAWKTRIALHLPDGGRLALLVWGDPSLYDSSLRISEKLRAGGMAIDVRVLPGITSIQALTAAHAIPLNALAEPVIITTGRKLREHGWPQDADSVVVMLDGGCAFDTLDPQGIEIWWGAYLGMARQALVHGPLAKAAPRIVEARKALRERHGWIMDSYLMRRDMRHGT